MNEKIFKIAITDEQQQKVRQNSASSLPLNPTAQGWSAQKIREKLYRAICSDLGELDDNLLDIIVDKLLSVKEVFEALQSGEFVVKKAELFDDGEDGQSIKLTFQGLENRMDNAESALSLKENKSEKGVANGYASLDSSAKIPTSQLPDSILGQLEYKGTFNPSGGYPVSPEKGWYYIAIANALISGVDYKVGDWAVYNGVSWDKIDNTDAVMSVNGKSGNVVLDGTDISYDATISGLSSTNVKTAIDELAFEKADKAVLTNLVDNGDFTLDSNSDGLPDGFNTTFGNKSLLNGILTLQATGSLQIMYPTNYATLFNANDYYYTYARVKTNSNTFDLANTTDIISNNEWVFVSTIIKSNTPSSICRIVDRATSDFQPIEIDYIGTINLTETFGAGKEPTKEQMDAIIQFKGFFQQTPIDFKDLILLNGINATEVDYDNSTSGLAANKVQGAIDELTKKGFPIINKNLFDYSHNTGISGIINSSGVITTNDSYLTSDFIFLVAGVYTISIRKVGRIATLTYNNNKTPLVFNSTGSILSHTFTLENDGYVRFSVEVGNYKTTQIEVGEEKTSYITYGESISFPNSKVNKSLRISIFDEKITIFGSLGKEQHIVINASSKNLRNDTMFNFNNTLILEGTTTISSIYNNDDIAPIRTACGTIGANHGYIDAFVLDANGQTTVDVGSIWSDGITNYTLVKVFDGKCYFLFPYKLGDSNDYVPSIIEPINDLVHVSGATNQNTMSLTTYSLIESVDASGLFPTTNKNEISFYVDGQKVLSDGLYYCDKFTVKESYAIMSYKGIQDFLNANIGSQLGDESIPSSVIINNVYEFSKGAKCVVSTSIEAIENIECRGFGIIQAQALPIFRTGDKLYRYLNGVNEKAGYDFSNIVDMTSYATNINFLTSDLSNPNIPCNRYVDIIENNAEKSYAFSCGYIHELSESKDNNRVLNTSTLWDMRSSKKSYPSATQYGESINTGQTVSFLGYRIYLPKEIPTTNLSIIDIGCNSYIYIDGHSQGSFKYFIGTEHLGKLVSIEESENFILDNDFIDSEGIKFQITNSKGFAVLKLN